VGLRAGLDWCGKSRPHRDSIPEPSSALKYKVCLLKSVLGPACASSLGCRRCQRKFHIRKRCTEKGVAFDMKNDLLYAVTRIIIFLSPPHFHAPVNPGCRNKFLIQFIRLLRASSLSLSQTAGPVSFLTYYFLCFEG
jgi:hypothetical protein